MFLSHRTRFPKFIRRRRAPGGSPGPTWRPEYTKCTPRVLYHRKNLGVASQGPSPRSPSRRPPSPPTPSRLHPRQWRCPVRSRTAVGVGVGGPGQGYLLGCAEYFNLIQQNDSPAGHACSSLEFALWAISDSRLSYWPDTRFHVCARGGGSESTCMRAGGVASDSSHFDKTV